MNYFLQNHSIEYLKELKRDDFILPKNDRDIYLLVHRNMLLTYNAIEVYSNFNIKTGRSYPSNMLRQGYLNEDYDKSEKILETKEFTIDLEKGVISSNNNINSNYKIKRITILEDSKIKLEKSYISADEIYVIVDGRRVFIMKQKLYNSFLVQSLLFNNYNRDYFTEVARTKNFLLLKIRKEEDHRKESQQSL
jgi:mannose-6-phosphate isomerase-like protein (cupin superfamily)